MTRPLAAPTTSGDEPRQRATRVTVTEAGIRVAAVGTPRLLSHLSPTGAVVGLRQHRQGYAPAHMADPRRVRHAVEASALAGRGGAGFPAARKMAAVSERGGHVVVVNATEGEPASAKDRLLLTTVPHLVLDGAELAARVTGATDVVICIDWTDRVAVAAVNAAIAQRVAAGEPPIRVAVTPPRYVTGEESALVNFLNGGPAVPTSSRERPFERGVGGRPTLVHNAETLAHLAVANRYGPEWYRTSGTPEEPGTMMLTVTIARGVTTVLEAPIGVTGLDVLRTAGVRGPLRAILVGGYFGTWLRAADFASAPISRAGLAPFGASPGAGVVIALPSASCVLAETARILSWYAGESAGQCGPCVSGLPALADVTAALAHGKAATGDLERLHRWAGDIEGRGACRHPDGAVRLLRSALAAFPEEVERHATGHPCAGANAAPFLDTSTAAGNGRRP